MNITQFTKKFGSKLLIDNIFIERIGLRVLPPKPATAKKMDLVWLSLHWASVVRVIVPIEFTWKPWSIWQYWL